MNNTIFKDRKNGVYIECGANDGIRDSISWFYENHFNWSGILVEPLHEMMAKCKAARGDRNIFVEMGLGDMDGEIEIEVPDDNLDNSSIVMPESHRAQLKSVGYGRSFHKETIKMTSYANMIAKTGVKHVDLAIFDVEGYEDHILSSLVESNVLPEIMVVEKDWSDKDKLIGIVSGKYDVIKEFEHDIVFRLKA